MRDCCANKPPYRVCPQPPPAEFHHCRLTGLISWSDEQTEAAGLLTTVVLETFESLFFFV